MATWRPCSSPTFWAESCIIHTLNPKLKPTVEGQKAHLTVVRPVRTAAPPRWGRQTLARRKLRRSRSSLARERRSPLLSRRRSRAAWAVPQTLQQEQMITVCASGQNPTPAMFYTRGRKVYGNPPRQAKHKFNIRVLESYYEILTLFALR